VVQARHFESLDQQDCLNEFGNIAVIVHDDHALSRSLKVHIQQPTVRVTRLPLSNQAGDQ